MRRSGRLGRWRPVDAAHMPVARRPSIVGQAAPSVRGVAPDGTDAEVPGGRAVHLLFLTASCKPCQPLWHAAQGAPGTGPSEVVMVTPGPETEDRRRVMRLASPRVPVVMSGEAWSSFGVTGAPWLIAVDDSGTITFDGPAPLSWEEIGAPTQA